jgi:hypothetical protein
VIMLVTSSLPTVAFGQGVPCPCSALPRAQCLSCCETPPGCPGNCPASCPPPTPTPTTASTSMLSFRNGFVGEIGAGHRFNKSFRSAVVFQHKGARSRNYSEGASARLSMYGVMLNGYLDLSNRTILTPYIMAGAGLGHNNTKISVLGTASTSRRTNFIWHTGAGCQAKLDKNLSLDLSYRYEDIGRFGGRTMGDRTVRIKRSAAHEFTAGLVYNFASTSASKRAHNFVLIGGGFMKFS